MQAGARQNNESYLESYVHDISPKLKAIDLFLKCAEGDINVDDAARLLYITPNEVRRIMRRNKIKKLDKRSFFRVMEQGESDICRLYKRELDCGSPHIYSIENISYIYGLNPETVNSACEKLHIREVTAYTLPILFSNIYV